MLHLIWTVNIIWSQANAPTLCLSQKSLLVLLFLRSWLLADSGIVSHQMKSSIIRSQLLEGRESFDDHSAGLFRQVSVWNNDK